MKPVLILQHLDADGPGYLRTFLEREGVPFEVVNSQQGEAFPSDIRRYGALAVLGGEMSANDPLPSLRQAERLILDAVDAAVPVIGHCLGGQLMARALGAQVGASRAPEIGWHTVRFSEDREAASWFGPRRSAVVFQWHYDAFALPAGAVLLGTSDQCAHQAFSIGPHLAMQFHVEIDAQKLATWTATHDERFEAALRWPSVQGPAQMLEAARSHLAPQRALADWIYRRWLSAAHGQPPS